MDKQIIIDGVDVSKCTCFDDGECLNPCETVTSCEASINCYYKNWQRAEQKLERIKNVIEVYFDDDWKATREIEKILQK